MFALPISKPRFKSIQISPKLKLFLQKNAKFSSAGGSAPRPPHSPPIANFWLRAWSIHSQNNLEHLFVFCMQVFCQAGPSQSVDCLAPTENERNLSKGRNDLLPVRESIPESASFQSPT